jgi:glycosyltransferase involved in cell wall biosynthesis
MKIILFANTEWYLYNFRCSLAEKLKAEGWEVVLISPPGEYGPKLQELGFRWLPFPFSTRSTNPFNELAVIFRLIKLYRRERPALCHHFTIKCVLYGSLAARFSHNPPVVNSVTGMGHIFTDPGLKARVLRPLIQALYRFVFKPVDTRVVFQNSQDLDYFVNTDLVNTSQARLIRGSGVNTTLFKPTSSVPYSQEKSISILFASRLMREKGVFELLEAARILKAKGVDATFLLAGDIYPENPSSLTVKDIETIQQQGDITFLGHVDDMHTLLAKSDIVVLPSYREGTPRILIEAAAMEKPIVATNIAGCAGLVIDGVNGLLVPVKDSTALAEALNRLIADKILREQFGQAGRKIVLGEFDETIVLAKTRAVYQEIIGNGVRFTV